jgi:hypothetical protein
MRADLLRQKARRYFKISKLKYKDKVRYVKMHMTEFIRFD